MAPLWLRYPSYDRSCMGWRMGDGADYVTQFGRWLGMLSREEKDEYQRMFPEPHGWLGWYDDKFPEVMDEHLIIEWEKGDLPKYSRQKLIEQLNSGSTAEYLLFFGHQPSRDGSLARTCLSQWWQSPFTVMAEDYFCMEQYMMAQKAFIFENAEIRSQIMQSDAPKEIKALGRKVKNFREVVWNQKRHSVVLNGNFAKFFQTPALKSFLLGTQSKVLVEVSPYDTLWGIGLAQNAPRASDPRTWRGLNLLGFALMEVRDELRRVCRNEKLVDWAEGDPAEVRRKRAELATLFERHGIHGTSAAESQI